MKNKISSRTRSSTNVTTSIPPATNETSISLPPHSSWRRTWVFAVILLVAGGMVAWAVLIGSRNAPEGMVWIPGGEYIMGDERFPESKPLHRVYVDGFWMDKTEVTNAQYLKFTEATGYKTVAERQPDPKMYPGADPKNLVPGSALLVPPVFKSDEECQACLAENGCDRWWKYVPGASWRHPLGPDSDIKDKMNHPVVHIAWEDAMAYCTWAGKRLPTEAEWERAARGGLERMPYYWGTEKNPGGKWMANTYQGKFPSNDSGEDGFKGTAPVGSFPPNGYGLHDVSGNVWEWCSDWYQDEWYKSALLHPQKNPRGPEFSIDPHGNREPKRVMRGGSFLCADSYCIRYLAGARHHGAVDTGLMHNGFRCAKSE